MMYRKWSLLIALFLTGCATHEVPTVIDVRTNGTGPQIAANLTAAYADKATMCRNRPTAPAFLCSGVMLRGTVHSSAFFFWNPNPASTGVSFSYLRDDANYRKLSYSYNNGFIFYPLYSAPGGKIYPKVLCFFPVDGATLERSGEGCGASPSYPSTSRPCQSQGINTAAQYIAHYNSLPQKYDSLCGFDVRDNLNEAATTAFNEGLKAQGMGGSFAFQTQNEIRIEKWAQDSGATLPIQAVFYLDNAGKLSAQADQRDFKNQNGIWIPMIKITLPQTTTQKATFQFVAADQAISS